MNWLLNLSYIDQEVKEGKVVKQYLSALSETPIFRVSNFFSSIRTKFSLFLILLMVILFFGVLSAEAANHYIRDGGLGSLTGTGDCTTWEDAHACDNFPATLVRGDTYYVASGSYGAKTWNTGINGTQVITIKKATISDQGIATGWLASYATGQAVWTAFTVSTSYWTFDGVTGGGPGAWETGLGFLLDMPDSGGTQAEAITFGPGVTQISFRHMEIAGRGIGYAQETDLFYIVNPLSNLTIAYSFLRDVNRTMILTWPAGASGITVEYTKFARNGLTAHREAWSAGTDSNVIVRYNQFEDICGTSNIAIVNGLGTASNWDIYGNVFYHTGDNASCQINTGIIYTRDDLGGGSCDETTVVCVSAVNWHIYNNVFAHIRDVFQESGQVRVDGNPTNFVVENNIWYANQGGWSGCYNVTTCDYNWMYGNTGGNVTNGAHDIAGSANPFVSSTPWTSGNWALAAGIGGLALASAYNVDMNGVTRGADGVWDRGALEFNSGGANPPPSAPQNLRIQ